VYFDTGFIIALLALTIALATLPASEIETGFADLILARPLPRHWLITRTIALVLFSILLMLLMIMAGTWAGLALFAPPDAPWPSARQTGLLALSLGMLVMCWSGIAMALGAAYRRGVAARPRPCLPSPRCSWIGRTGCGRPWTASPGCRHSTTSTRMDWSRRPTGLEDLLVLCAMAMTGFTVAYFRPPRSPRPALQDGRPTPALAAGRRRVERRAGRRIRHPQHLAKRHFPLTSFI
jgi:hypothetical protein